MDPTVASMTPDDEPDVEALLDAAFAGRYQARLGEVIDVLGLPGFVAREGSRIVGVAMDRVDGEAAELAAIVVTDDQRRAGTGTALVEAVVEATAAAGARRLWLVTMNDNVDALRFYQRRGFHLAELHAGAADTARKLKPSIPRIGAHGIPIRDELVVVRPLCGGPRSLTRLPRSNVRRWSSAVAPSCGGREGQPAHSARGG